MWQPKLMFSKMSGNFFPPSTCLLTQFQGQHVRAKESHDEPSRLRGCLSRSLLYHYSVYIPLPIVFVICIFPDLIRYMFTGYLEQRMSVVYEKYLPISVNESFSRNSDFGYMVPGSFANFTRFLGFKIQDSGEAFLNPSSD